MVSVVADLDLPWDADPMVARRVRDTSDVVRLVLATARALTATTTVTGVPPVVTTTTNAGTGPRLAVDPPMTTRRRVDGMRIRTDANMALRRTPTPTVDRTIGLLVTSPLERVAVMGLVKAAVILERIIVEAVVDTDAAPILREWPVHRTGPER